MGTPRPSVLKKQREQKKRERQAIKAEKRAQRKIEGQVGGNSTSEQDEYEMPDVANNL